MASGDTLLIFSAINNEPPSSNYATLDTRNGLSCLDFDGTTQETAIFTAIMPNNYTSGNMGIFIHHASTTGVTGTVGWIIDFDRVGDRQLDLDSDSYGTSYTIPAETVSATAGHVDIVSGILSPSTHLDLTSRGEMFKMRVKRDVANDTCPSDVELYAIELREL